MPAIHPFRRSDEAVSPVIGVILMVAITVVLAAVVFILVGNFGKSSNQNVPSLGFSQDKSAHTLTVIHSEPANWRDIKIQLLSGSGAGCTGTDASGAILGAVGTIQAGTARAVSATDKVTVTDAVPGQVCTLQLTYAPANQLLGAWAFYF
jgi:flagellin-like protein